MASKLVVETKPEVSGRMEAEILEEPGKLRKVLNALRSASVEPAAVFVMTSNLVTYFIFQDLLFFSICHVERNNTEQFCRELVKSSSYNSTEELDIQKSLAFHKSYRSLIDHTFPCFFTLFMGPWSDQYGRKVPLLISSFGVMMYGWVTMLCSLYSGEISPLTLNLLTAIPRALTGGEVAFAMAAYSFVSDQTSHEYRTVRTGVLNAGYQLGVPLGMGLVTLLMSNGFGHAGSFGLAGIIALVALLIILFKVKDDKDRMAKAKIRQAYPSESRKVDNSAGSGSGICYNVKKSFVGVASLPFKKRRGGRLRIWLLLLVFIFTAAPIHGEFQVFYMITRIRLDWSVSEYTNFACYNWFIGIAGVTLSMGILSKWMRLPDPVVGFISGISQLGGCVMYTFAMTAVMLRIAATVDMMNGTMIVIARSMMSKLVQPEEIGKLFSLIATLESLIPLGMDPMYTLVYAKTVEFFEGSVFIMSAVFTAPPLLIYLWFILNQKPKRYAAADPAVAPMIVRFSTDVNTNGFASASGTRAADANEDCKK